MKINLLAFKFKKPSKKYIYFGAKCLSFAVISMSGIPFKATAQTSSLRSILLDTGIFVCDALTVTSQLMIYSSRVPKRTKRICFGVVVVSSLSGSTLRTFKPVIS
jgi:hypothetical protein